MDGHATARPEPVDDEPLLIANEFADVVVRRVMTRNGMRLEISAPRTGTSVHLDALELEGLTRQPKELFSSLLERSTNTRDEREHG